MGQCQKLLRNLGKQRGMSWLSQWILPTGELFRAAVLGKSGLCGSHAGNDLACHSW